MNLNNIPFGEPEKFNVVIEIPQGSNQKFEYDEKSENMVLNFVFKDLYFPFNYGFIPGTLGGDGDTLDAIVLSSAPIKSGEVVACKTTGVMETLDRGQRDDKIICVPLDDELAVKYQNIDNLPPDSLQKWTEFYLEVARQKKKVIEILGLKNKKQALFLMQSSLTNV